MRRSHAHGRIAKIRRTRRRRLAKFGGNVMGTDVPARAPIPELLRRRHALVFVAIGKEVTAKGLYPPVGASRQRVHLVLQRLQTEGRLRLGCGTLTLLPAGRWADDA